MGVRTYLACTRSLDLLVPRRPGYGYEYGALERSFESRLAGDGGVEAQARARVWVGKVQGEVGRDVADQRRYAVG